MRHSVVSPHHALSTMIHAPCTMHYAQSTIYYAPWIHALCTIYYSLCTIYYAPCTYQCFFVGNVVLSAYFYLLALMYIFQVLCVLLSIQNAKFGPFLANFGYFLWTFTGPNNVVVNQNWQIWCMFVFRLSGLRVIPRVIRLTLRCWGNSSIPEGRFSKWF